MCYKNGTYDILNTHWFIYYLLLILGIRINTYVYLPNGVLKLKILYAFIYVLASMSSYDVRILAVEISEAKIY
jgi:hypothetical protein